MSLLLLGFPGGSVKNPPAIARGMGLILGSGRSPGKGNGNALQYSCLGNPIDREAWWAAVHGVARIGHVLETKQQQLTLFRYQSNKIFYENGRREKGDCYWIRVLHCLAPSVMVIGIGYSKWPFREKIYVQSKLL